MAALPGCVGSLAREREKLRSAHMSELLSAMPDCSPERAAIALHTVDSRTVYSHPARVRALVPFFDFANHCAHPNARWTMGSDRVLRLFSTRPIDLGEEVTICYDNISNGRLLVTYGFVLEGKGPHRCVDLNIMPVHSQEVAEQRRPVQLEVLGDGCLRRRAALLPILGAFRVIDDVNAEALLAEHLLQEAAKEQRQWEDRQPILEDHRFMVLSTMIIQVLGAFMDKITAWKEDPEKTSLMGALGPEALGIGSDSEDSEV